MGVAAVRAAALAVALLVAACGGRAPAEPPDPTLARLSRTGLLAWRQDRPAQAADLFRQALDRAYARDDAAAIGDNAANLAVALLRTGKPEQARDTAAGARAELARRGAAVPVELTLAEAAARYRTRDPAGSVALTRGIAAPPEAAARARFLEGLVAADARDGAGLAAAINALPPTALPGLAADRDELVARLGLLSGDAAGARIAAERAAMARQDERDYAGMARALALAGEALAGGDPAAAAGFYLRAGRSVATDQAPAPDRVLARVWLSEARRLAAIGGAADVGAAANERLRVLTEAEGL